jgi:predicted deacylase
MFQLTATPGGSVERFSIHTVDVPGFGPVDLPAVVVRGAKPGRTLFAVAGIHGNEYEGMEAIRLVLRELNPLRVAGAFAAIIVANPMAYRHRSRATPPEIDGLNLARVFPGDPSGSPTRRLAAALFDLIDRNLGPADLLLDLHSGTAEVAFATMAGFRDLDGPARRASEEAARHMGLPRLWAIPDAPGPLNAETARIGIPSVGTETTGRAGCQPSDARAYADGIWHLLAYLGICPDRPQPPRDDRPARPTFDVVSPATGFLRNDRNLDDRIEAGKRLGVLVDSFGEPLAEITSPVSGTIWAARATPGVSEGELAFMVAKDAP